MRSPGLSPDPAPHSVAHGGEPCPQGGEPLHRHQLELDHFKEPFNDHQTNTVGHDQHSGPGQPMSVTRDEQGHNFQRLHEQERQEHQRKRLIGS